MRLQAARQHHHNEPLAEPADRMRHHSSQHLGSKLVGARQPGL